MVSKDDIIKEYLSGKRGPEIASMFSITRERVYQIIRELKGVRRQEISVLNRECRVCHSQDYSQKVSGRIWIRKLVFIRTEFYVCENCKNLYRCNCGYVGPRTDFAYVIDTHSGRCKNCNRLDSRYYYENNFERVRVLSKKWREKHRSYFKKWSKARIKKRIRLGLCTRCGSKKDADGYKFCVGCRKSYHSGI